MDDNDKDFIELAEMINELYTNIVRHYGSIIPLAAIIERKKTDPYKRLMELQQEIDGRLKSATRKPSCRFQGIQLSERRILCRRRTKIKNLKGSPLNKNAARAE